MSVGRIAAWKEFGARLAGSLPPAPAAAQHFYLIDLFRGVAAVVILLCHYYHFYIPWAAGDPLYASPAQQPFYGVLWPFYEYGRRAVQFFWAISGFVLASAYLHSTVSAADFARNRLARLYPLHFLTLIVVAVLQAISMHLTGHFQIVVENDWYHFLLNVFFASAWGFAQNTSFNAPIWSVSIEIAIYAAFWACLPFLFRRGVLYPALLAAGFAVMTQISSAAFWTCGLFFFAGTTMFAVYRLVGGTTVAGLVGAALCASSIAVMLAGADIQVPLAITFAGAILMLASFEDSAAGRFAHRQRWLGDSTYGIYLWHLPIQIVVLILFATAVLPRSMADSPFFLFAFMGAAISAGWLSYRYFERSTRAWLRDASGWPRTAKAAL
jgi:peptidoglycan/LPS O-acetylase OafA/YrhL